mgnify:FL=1
MNERTLKVLEFHKIKEMLKEHAATSVGRKLADQLTPHTNIEKVQKLQDETDEALTIYRLNQAIPFANLVDVSDSVKRSAIGSVLNTTECLEIAQVLYSGRQLKNFIENLEAEIPLLTERVSDISPLHHLEKEIKLKIDEHGEVVDDASPTLKSIRQTIRTYEARVRERLQQLIRTKSKMLSDTIVTIRNDRYVLPVKHEHRSAIGGIVHDQSSSGQTLFMEPRAIIELNNNIQQLMQKEKREIEVILRKLTSKIAQFKDDILRNLQIIAEVDFINARARIAMEMNATKPILNTDGFIALKRVRHPLIPDDEVVANDIELGKDYHAIVITGPNTGGKTVTLKTIGLCTLMAQSGLQIPAFEGSKVAVFEKIFADIGDEQSIEQSLSTFSSHMTNIVSMMEKIDETSLVLFDELGAGTDPQEGAALAMALLDEVILRKARVVATTHYPELKAYGYNRESVMNASMEFDVETLRPTYRLLIGVPGRSNAFEISDRLGLKKEIIDRAKGYLGIDSKNVENMIAALERTKKEAEKELDEAQFILEEAETLHVQLKNEWNAFLRKREQLYREAEEKAEKALEKAKEEAEMIVDEVRQMKDRALFKEHEWIEAKKMLEEAKPELTKEDDIIDDKTEMEELSVGDEIKHKTLQQTGQIIEKKNKNEYVIQIGMMKITAKRKDLIFVEKQTEDVKEEQRPITRVVTAADDVKTELDLRGERYEDAMNILEKYIDDALVRGYPRVTIIHGKGTGSLRKGVEKFIQSHPYIKNYRLGAANEGGSGVTIVEFK